MGLFFHKENRAEEIVSDTIDESDFSGALLSAVVSDARITRDQALQLPTVAACVSIISGIIGSLPIKLYRQEENKTVVQNSDNRLFVLNRDTGDTLTLTQFWRAMISDYYLGSGGYAYIHREYTIPKSLHYVKRSCVSILHNADHIYKDYAVMVDGQRYQPFDFFKLLRNTEDGWKSKPLTEENAIIFATAYREYVLEHSLAVKGGNKKGFLTSEFQMNREQISNVKKAFRRLFGTGEENAIVLPKGTKFQESSNTSVEMQLNENKESNAKAISAIFHVPYSIIEGQGTKEDFDTLIKLAVMPLVNDIETELNRVFLLEEEKASCYFAIDTTKLTRGSIEERYNAYKTALEANFLQIDEVRNMEDMPPMGIDFIKLGLDAVLYNPTTKQAYTPNIDKISTVDGSAGKEDAHASGNQG